MEGPARIVFLGLALLAGAFQLLVGITGDWDSAVWRTLILIAGVLAVGGALLRSRRPSIAADVAIALGGAPLFALYWTVFGPLLAAILIVLAALDAFQSRSRRLPST
jgi:hypothetical protein